MNNTNNGKMPPRNEEILRLALDRLEGDGVPIPEGAADQLTKHAAAAVRWSAYASLVSHGDESRVIARHTVDSLSLAAHVLSAAGAAGSLLDVGSGGGFPAIPLKIVLPGLRVHLVERSEKKVGVLRQMLLELGLTDVRVTAGVFPRACAGETPAVITARAVERSAEFREAMAAWLPEGAVFLNQAGDNSGFPPEMFHVEPVEDGWAAAGLRRGNLHAIRRVPRGTC